MSDKAKSTGFVKANKDLNSERWARRLSPNFWVSVLYRLTGFGYWEWETAICTAEPKACNIVRGDHRTTLAEMTEAEICDWYKEHKDQKNSMESLLDTIKP